MRQTRLESFKAVELGRALQVLGGREDLLEGWSPPSDERWASLLAHSPKAIFAALQASNCAIFGQDGRRDFRYIRQCQQLEAADCVAAVFAEGDVRDYLAYPRVRLVTKTYGLVYGLCERERFWGQECGALGTAFLVASDLVVTAWHVLHNLDKKVRFVFGFRVIGDDAGQVDLPSTEVYKLKSVVAQVKIDKGADWAVVRLDRPVRNHRWASIRRAGTIAPGTKLYALGHPGGLPLKIVEGARVRAPSDHAEVFVTSLDCNDSMSGAPIFNAEDHVIEGIVTRAPHPFFVPDNGHGGCKVSMVCDEDGGAGVTCMRIQPLAKHIPIT